MLMLIDLILKETYLKNKAESERHPFNSIKNT